MKSLSSKNILFSVIILAIAVHAARGLGFIREIIVAKQIGPSQETDAVYLALQIVLVAASAVVISLPDVVIGEITKNKLEKDKGTHIWSGLWGISITLIFLATVMFLFSPLIVRIVASGASYKIQSMSVHILKHFSWFIVFRGQMVYLTAVCHAERKFCVPAVFEFFFPLGGIIGILLFGKQIGAKSILYGALFGILLAVSGLVLYVNFAVQKISMNIKLKTLWCNGIIKNFLVVLAGAYIFRIELNVLSWTIAQFGTTGGIFLLSVAIGLVNITLILPNFVIKRVALPEIVSFHVHGESELFIKSIFRTCQIILMLVLPLCVVFLYNTEECISIIYKGGAFTNTSVTNLATLVRGWAGFSWIIAICLLFESVVISTSHGKWITVGRVLYIIILIAFCNAFGSYFGNGAVGWAVVMATTCRFIYVINVFRKISKLSTLTLLYHLGKIFIYIILITTIGFLFKLLPLSNNLIRIIISGAGLLVFSLLFSWMVFLINPFNFSLGNLYGQK
mgnify:CR=1 FL=1